MTQAAPQLSPTAQQAVGEALNQCLAETAVTTMLAQNFHWNVTGMSFGQLHALFEEIYTDHFTGQDDLAERVRALGVHAEGRLAVHVERSKVAERDGHESAKEMIEILAQAQETVSATLAGTADVASEHGDDLSEDLAIERGRIHDKFAWMLRAHLE